MKRTWSLALLLMEGMNLLYDNAVKVFMEEGAPHLTAENKDKITKSWLEEQVPPTP
tara:strand:- start:147 stop:314 length:168 start_codon:yes stop_codon:yes gene_type:complete